MESRDTEVPSTEANSALDIREAACNRVISAATAPDGSAIRTVSNGVRRINCRIPVSIPPSSPRMIFPGVTRLITQPSLGLDHLEDRVEAISKVRQHVIMIIRVAVTRI